MSLINVSVLLLWSLTSCTPDFFKSAENVLTDDAIKVSVDKDAFQKDTDVSVVIEIKKKDI